MTYYQHENKDLRSSVESVSSACHWKFFTKPYFCINPAGKLKVPSWKIFISQQENYFFSLGKSKFRSRVILDDCLGLFLNYFKRFLFILTPISGLWTKVKMFDIERWAMSDEQWAMSSERWVVSDGGRDVACSVRREYKSYNPTNLTKYCLKPLAGLAWVKTSDIARRRLYILATHYSLLTAHRSKCSSVEKWIRVPFPIFVKKQEKGIFGVRKKNVKDFNLLIIKWIQTNEITSEITRKKDLSVSGVSLKSFWKNT